KDVEVTAENWRELNPLDIRRHIGEQVGLLWMLDPSSRVYRVVNHKIKEVTGAERLESIAGILGMSPNSECEDKEFSLSDPDSLKRDSSGKEIMRFGANSYEAKLRLIEYIINYDHRLDPVRPMPTLVEVPPLFKLSMYKIDHGPGDVCLVEVVDGGPHLVGGRMPCKPYLSDRRMGFVRGNVMVYLFSKDPDVGCMARALEIDAKLKVRQKLEKKQSPTDTSPLPTPSDSATPSVSVKPSAE
ncbi:MAG: hypothetical protein Q4C96_00420, partial [Planctomycetia bacterium]|nr:hypothetical protein [Planctomycetia bacterium]